MTDAGADALAEFSRVLNEVWPDLRAATGPPDPDDDDDDDDDDEPSATVTDQDLETRRVARRKLLDAWREYVNVIGSKRWDHFEKWVMYVAGDIHVRVKVGDEYENGPEFQALIDTYGEQTWNVLHALQEEAREQGHSRFPSRESDFARPYEPTLHGQPWRPSIGYGGPRHYPPAGADLQGLGRRIGGLGHLRWWERGAPRAESLDGVLRMDERGIDWADKKVFKKQVHGFAAWDSVTAFASKGPWIVFADRLSGNRIRIVEFRGSDEQDVVKMYSLARLAFPGPERLREARTSSSQAWRPIGDRWGDHWWVWNDNAGNWIFRHLFEKDHSSH